MFISKIWKKISFLALIMVILIFLINGCARWPDEPNGENGIGQKQLIIRVDINEDGTINPDEGNYYIVFDTNKDAPFGPDDDIENWQQGYYYVRLDNIGFFFGEVLEVGTSEQFISGTVSEKYFQVSLPLADLGDPTPAGIHMNVVTTDRDNEIYDSLNPDFYINTNLIFPKTETDFLGDSTGGPDFDIAQVTTTIIVP